MAFMHVGTKLHKQQYSLPGHAAVKALPFTKVLLGVVLGACSVLPL